MSEERDLHIHKLDPALKAMLIAESEARRVSVNHCLIGALAEHFAVPFDGTGRRRSPGATVSDGAVVLAVPALLYQKIVEQEGLQPKGRRSKRAVVEDVLREHFAALVVASAAAPAMPGTREQ